MKICDKCKGQSTNDEINGLKESGLEPEKHPITSEATVSERVGTYANIVFYREDGNERKGFSLCQSCCFSIAEELDWLPWSIEEGWS